MRQFKYLLISLFLFWNHAVMAQTIALTAVPATSAQQLVDALSGTGVELSNVVLRGPIGQTGTFNNPIGVLGIREGIVLATGSVNVADGPNLNCENKSDPNCIPSGGVSTSLGSNATDPVLDEISISQNTTYQDALILEFDIKPKGNKISFQYVMGSEEYTEDDEDFPDMFGFFISGPGIVGEINLALVPNSNDVVTTGTVNDLINSQFYNDNGSGDDPLINSLLGYDGYTDVFTAEYNVLPCETYHLKMVIADANDSAKDSGVFIEQGSFNSVFTPVLTVEYDSPLDTVFEGCADFELKVNNSFAVPFDFPLLLTYSGTSNGLDFVSLPDRLTIPLGEQEASFNYKSIIDGKEDIESLIISVSPVCDNSFDIDSIVVPIRDEVERIIPDYLWCNKDTFSLQSFNNDYDSLNFELSNLVSCTNCTDPSFYFVEEDTITYKYIEKVSGCEYVDSFSINQFIPSFTYELGKNEYYTSLDIQGDIVNSNLDSFDWEFNETETITGETVIYQAGNINRGEICVPIKITGYADSLKCSDVQETIRCLEDSLIVPNIISPNGDGFNETFTINGIVSGNWNIELYNRYGQLIYKKENYEFDFSGENVSEGVYYYLLENKFRDRAFKGWLQIVR